MKINQGHLTYCSNIHPGVSWKEHFAELKENVPYVRRNLTGKEPLALGLRCANEASLELEKPENLSEFKNWLEEENLYVFCINGFPYGSFHHSVVKDQVHAPDWTTRDRVDYTKRLFRILAALIPEGMHGAVSTPPLSYRHWWGTQDQLKEATLSATRHIVEVLDYLIDLKTETGKTFHLDIEPEPDGILDNGKDFFSWYEEVLIPEATAFLIDRRAYTTAQARDTIIEHIQLCYDVCHFAISYESPEAVLKKLKETGIKVGRIQISSALKVDLTEKREEKLATLLVFNEPVYLHQVVAKTSEQTLLHFPDLDQALASDHTTHSEWRIHFHVPIFIGNYGLLAATQPDIVEVLKLQKEHNLTSYLEVETYTWGVLPQSLQMPVADSIVRELDWVREQLDNL